MRKSIKLLSLSLAALLILSGCNGNDEPEATVSPDNTPSKDAAEVVMTTKDLGDIQISFEEGKWISPTQSSEEFWVLMYADSANTAQACNITIEKTSQWKSKIDSEYLTWFENSMKKEKENGITLVSSELRTVNDLPVAYIESTLKFTSELLNEMLNEGIATKDDLDFMGGAEALLSADPIEQISMHTKIGDEVYVFAGTYYNAQQKQIIIDAISSMIATAQKSS